jgi:hypothetical protein
MEGMKAVDRQMKIDKKSFILSYGLYLVIVLLKGELC